VGRKVLCSLFAGLLLILSAGVSISLSIWIESLLSMTGIEPVYLTIVVSLIMLIYNVVIWTIVGLAIKIIYLDTATD
jgi:hypothetical protein